MMLADGAVWRRIRELEYSCVRLCLQQKISVEGSEEEDG
jgi:hypothetical protein